MRERRIALLDSFERHTRSDGRVSAGQHERAMPRSRARVDTGLDVKMKEGGELECIGKGPAARWSRRKKSARG
jgi:hypothetical protein